MSLSLNQTLLTFWFYVKQIGWLIWFWQFLCDRLSSFNPKGFYYSYTWSCSLCEGRTSFCRGLFTGKLYRFLQIQLAFTMLSVLFFSSLDHLLCLYAWFLVLFHLTWMRFSQSTQAFQWIFCARAINCCCKEVFSKIAQGIYCLP